MLDILCSVRVALLTTYTLVVCIILLKGSSTFYCTRASSTNDLILLLRRFYYYKTTNLAWDQRPILFLHLEEELSRAPAGRQTTNSNPEPMPERGRPGAFGLRWWSGAITWRNQMTNEGALSYASVYDAGL
jgi:hypothetical protein